MARTPSKKKSSKRHGRSGPRDSCQHVHAAGSNLFLPNSKGHRHGSHGPPGSQRAPIPLDGDNHVKNNARLRDPNLRRFCNVRPSGSTSTSNAVKSTSRKRDDDVIVLDDSPPAVAEGGEHPGEHPLELLVAYRGDEEPEDVQIQRALLKSRMIRLMKRKSNANFLGFPADHYKSLLFGLLGPSPKFLRRDELIAMALQADPSGVMMENMTNVLPAKLSKRDSLKYAMAELLVDIFFVVQDVIISSAVTLPPPHSALAKGLSNFLVNLVRVRNYSSHMLANETTASKAQRSEPITEKEMREPWTNDDLKSLGEYATCPKCDGGFTRWHRKASSEMENRRLKKQYNKDMKEYERRIKKGEKVTRPVLKQLPLMVSCCSYQVGCSVYGDMIPCGKCKDGSCRICQSSCSFVVKISNYNDVKLARLAKERELPVPADVYNARTYLNSATSLKEDTIEAATTSYKQMEKEGKLKPNANISRAISHQASLETSHFVLHNPPGSHARHELAAKMKLVSHPRGASWIKENGVDRNLGSYGAEMRVNNNKLKDVQEFEMADSEEDEVVLVERSKSNPDVLMETRQV